MIESKPAKRRPTQYETRLAIQELQEALESLARYIDPADTRCAVDSEARKKSQLFMRSWVQGPAERALKMLKRSQEGEDAAKNRWDLPYDYNW